MADNKTEEKKRKSYEPLESNTDLPVEEEFDWNIECIFEIMISLLRYENEHMRTYLLIVGNHPKFSDW